MSEPGERYRTPLARLPIRLRVATGVGLVVFAILTVFAVAVERLESHRLWTDFNAQVESNAQFALHGRQHLSLVGNTIQPPISDLVGNVGAVVRVLSLDGSVLGASDNKANLGSPVPGVVNHGGYRVVTQSIGLLGVDERAYLQYAQPLSEVSSEVDNLRLILLIGVLAATALAFGAGSLVARRAITPIAELTAAASEIERTGDLSRSLPEPTADDEVAVLSRTLASMLTSLAGARTETESMLERQRAFVADASHELRTPLTSVLANLELLVESLDGADREAAQSALRSTQRMRRLVGDLLLLARADAGRVATREPLDLADTVLEAASELEPASHDHVLELDVRPTPTVGSRDDLQRVVTNLVENALRHTPPGTRVTASARSLPGGGAELVVADDGPGIPPDTREKIFERFVRGAGDRGGSFGLGLAIVAAVVAAHDGTVTVDESPHGGARFTVRLPPPEPLTTPPERLTPALF